MEAYLVEPQSLFVPFLSDVLAGAAMHVVRVAPTLDVDDIRAVRPEALFLDTDFLDGDPIAAVSELRSALPRTFICAYTADLPPQRLRYAGADCVLSKRSLPRQVADVLLAAQAAGAGTDPRCEETG